MCSKSVSELHKAKDLTHQRIKYACQNIYHNVHTQQPTTTCIIHSSCGSHTSSEWLFAQQYIASCLRINHPRENAYSCAFPTSFCWQAKPFPPLHAPHYLSVGVTAMNERRLMHLHAHMWGPCPELFTANPYTLWSSTPAAKDQRPGVSSDI